ncbi:hypothetical protein ACFE04_018062 [Oxalis oulophora]
MDNYPYNNNNNNNNNNQYGYPPPNYTNQPHPPSNYAYPPPNYDPYHQNHPYPNPYTAQQTYPYPPPPHYPPSPRPPNQGGFYSGPLDYNSNSSSKPPPPVSSSYSGHFEYSPNQPSAPYAYGNPTPPVSYGLQHSGSFQYPPPASNTNGVPASIGNSISSPNHGRHHSSSVVESSSNGSTRPSVYPPLEGLLNNMHLSYNNHYYRPSAPASQAAASAWPPLPLSPTTPTSPSSCHSSSLSRDENDLYAYPNDSFSSRYGVEAFVRSESDNYSSHSHSSSFSGPSHLHSQSLQIVPAQKGSLKYLLLHGNLDIWVCDAKNLPNMDMFHKTLGDLFGKLPGNVSSKIEGTMNRKVTTTSDPYVSISIAGAVIGRTYVISNSENPVWMQHFYVPVAHHAAEVHFVVKDSDVVGSQLIGAVSIPVEQIFSGKKIEGTYPILNNSGKPCKSGAALRFSIQYVPMEQLSTYHHGVGAGPDYFGVPGTYFPLRKGGSVTLYQDAHVQDGSLPNIPLDQGFSYVHGKCWRDIFDAISQARRLIYITGWSVWHNVKLIRDGGPASNYTLGELLRSKSQEGVRVLLLIWDDPTSRSILGYKTDGVMATHDEETRRFFKHSSVHVLLCPRVAGKRHSWIKQREVETIYTHHQKTVIVDADAGQNRRKIIAFVGGLDLCDGRYDTPQHPLFKTLQTEHKDDYHNPTYTGNTAGCPREPWHDLHSKIDGPAAYDVLTNFEERWFKASKPQGLKKLKKSYDDALLRIERIQDIVGVADYPHTNENDPESWHVQIFRSIDSNSVKDFPKDPKQATAKNLVCGKNVLIDMSIHTAYVKAIRAAQHFIYIENQYFIGSSYNWNSHKDLGANNLIPMEIALKIAQKIRAHERFAAYIVIPMWPEGNPTGAATQRILYWQNKTMQMMYETIHKALIEVGLENAFSPQDYLNFFCLGNREIDAFGSAYSELPSPTGTSSNTPQAHSRKSRRFMIYVHSKGMIVDDEYVVVGSANINQRSMEGTRDTEIAMGAYQPHHTWARKQTNPRGQYLFFGCSALSGKQIHGYRMSLWAEHLGTLENCFTQPESIECVKRVRTLGEMNWKQFAAEEVSEMRGHLLKYPVCVDRKGKVRPLPECPTFPDVGGNIVGSFVAIQENLTI